MHICYISNGRRFTKSALRILLLSILRVFSINSSFVCSLPIHKRSSANAEGPWAHCQLKSYKCCTLSILRVFSINYSFVCSLLIHKRSSANAEVPWAHCQLKSYKMLHKRSTDCIWKGLQPANDLQSHSRSLPLLPFDRLYTISYWSSIVSVCLFSRY